MPGVLAFAMRINNNHLNLAFDREIEKSKTWLEDKVFDACGYSSNILLDRLMQRLVEVGCYPYALTVIALCQASGNYFPTSGTRINCSRAFMEIGSGRVTISFTQWLINQFDFLLHWAFCLVSILACRMCGSDQPAVLVFGVGNDSLFTNGSDQQFAAYCQSGPVEPLRDGKYFIIQSALKNSASSRPDFLYARHPLIALLREAHIGFGGRLRLLGRHCALLLRYMVATVRLPQLSLLGRDFAYSVASLELDRRGLIKSIVLTTSNYTRQPLWTRGLHRAKTHMVWYAQNFSSIAYIGDNLRSDIPALRWIRVDEHWVWTHSFAQYLGSQVHDAAIRVVGPIVWYLPEMPAPARSNNKIEVVVFDVSPFGDDIALKHGQITNYNRPPNLFAFIQNIIALRQGLEDFFHHPVSFRLKTKRGYNAVYDRTYFDYIEELDAMGSISLEHHSRNIYSLISSSHLVIVYPFTSPAYIAEYLNVPSIYYDPTNSIVGHNFGDSRLLIDFANSPEELLNSAISALSKVFFNNAMIH